MDKRESNFSERQRQGRNKGVTSGAGRGVEGLGGHRSRTTFKMVMFAYVACAPAAHRGGGGGFCGTLPRAWPYRTLAKTQVSRNELKRIEFLAGNVARNVGHTERTPS